MDLSSPFIPGPTLRSDPRHFGGRPINLPIERQEGAREVRGAVSGRWGSGELRGGGAAAYLSQEGGVHSKQLMHWRVKALQLALMMQSGREEEGPEVLVESAPTYTRRTNSLPGTQRPSDTPRHTEQTDVRGHKCTRCTCLVIRYCLSDIGDRSQGQGDKPPATFGDTGTRNIKNQKVLIEGN
jgi:hypothetical protein